MSTRTSSGRLFAVRSGEAITKVLLMLVSSWAISLVRGIMLLVELEKDFKVIGSVKEEKPTFLDARTSIRQLRAITKMTKV